MKKNGKNKFIIGLSTAVMGGILATGQVAYASDAPVIDEHTNNTKVVDNTYVDYTLVVDNDNAGVEKEASTDEATLPSQDKVVEVEQGAIPEELDTDQEQNQTLEEDSELTGDDKADTLNEPEQTDTAENTDQASETNSKEALLTEPSANTEDPTAVEKTEELSTETIAEEDTPPETDENLDSEVEADGLVENGADTTNTEADPVDEASTMNAHVSEENTESLTDKETAAANSTEQKDVATISAGAPLDGDGLSKTEQGSEPPETDKGAESPSGDVNIAVEEGYTDPEADAAKIKNKRETDLTPGDTAVYGGKDDLKDPKDGFKLEVVEPTTGNPDKTLYGYELIIDKETGQRTYTWIRVNSSVLNNAPATVGDKPMMEVGDKLSESLPEVTYKAEGTSSLVGGSQNVYGYAASEADLKHINNKDNSKTVLGMKDQYTKANVAYPRLQVLNGAQFEFKVNPWPDENDSLMPITLQVNPDKDYDKDKKVYVHGQEIVTNLKVENLDANALDRLTAKVYNPENGEIVPGAEVYIDGEGNVKVKLPDGAVDKDGKINKNSIFYNDPKFNGAQSLDVKLYARPRTAEEFQTVAGASQFAPGTYTDTGAGTTTITHKGKGIPIANQGIDRYDHYNLIGEFEINLDDESYYDIITKDINANKIETDKMLRLKAGVDKEIEQVDNPKSEAPHKYTTAITDKAVDSYLEEEYKEFLIPVQGEENKYRTRDNWLVEVDPDNPLNMKVSTPIGAKKGENLTLAVTHLFTNGSEKNFLMNYVVTEESIEKPNYKVAETEADQKVTNTPTNNYTKTKPKPVKYELESTSIEDNKGNIWTLSIDEETGVITAKAPGKIDKVSTINAPVIATYKDQKLKDKDGNDLVYTEKSNATFTATAPQEGEVTYSQDNTIEYETKVQYNPEKDPTESGIIQEGKNGKYTADYKVTYKEGEVVEGPTMVEGSERDRVEPIPQIFEIGTKGASVDVTAPDEQTITIPHTTDVTYDDTKPLGYREETPGEDGEKKITYEITQKDGKATVTATESTTKEVTPRKIVIGTKPIEDSTSEFTENKVPADNVKINYVADPSMKLGETKDGEVTGGEIKTVVTTKYNPETGKVETTEETTVTPITKTVYTGTQDFTGTINHTENHEEAFEVEYVYTDELNAGETKRIQEGKKGTYTVTYTHYIKNGEEVDKDGNKVTADFKVESIRTDGDAPQKEIIKIGTKPVEKVVEIPFDTQYIYDNTIAAGTTKTDKEGVVGYKKLVTTYDEANKNSVTTVADEKAAENKIVRIGGKTTGKEVITEDIAFNTRVEYDSSLKKGEWKYKVVDGVEQKGVAGVRKITVNIENSVATSTTEQVTAPVDAVILVGSEDFTGKISHDVTEALPYDVKVEYDPSMKAGEYKVETKGVAGSKTTRYTQAIKNGAAEGELKSEVIKTDDTKDAVDEVIKVGTKVLEDNTQKESNVPVNIKFTPSDKIAQGTALKGDYTEGKVVDKVVSKYNPETGKIESTITPEVTAAELEILVGTQAYTGTFEYVERRNIPYETTIKFDDTLKAGETRVDQEGVNGVEERKITQSFRNGTLSEQNIPENFTNISTGRNKIVSVGTMRNGTVVHKEPIPFEVEVKYDPSLKAGEYKYETDADGNEKTGVAGEQSITYTIVNSEVTNTSQPNITKQPEKAVILVGNKDFEGTVSHEVTREVPFEVEIEYDDTLKAGEYKVTQQGELGSETTKYEFNIKNGEAVDETPTTTIVESKSKDPVKQIVKVGRKPAENSNETNSEIGIDVRFVPDENKEQGSQPETSYTPGTVVNKVVSKYDPVSGQIVTSTEPEVTKGVIEIKYGTKDYTGEVKYVEKEYIDYTTEVTVDYTLKPNEVVVDTKGQVGIKERNVTQKVVNGELKETLRDDQYRTTSQPVTQKIRVGVGITAEKPQDKTIAIPFDTKIVYDEDQPLGYSKIDTEGKNGSVTITFSEEIRDGKVTITATEDKTDPTTQVVTIGTKAIQNVTGSDEKAIEPKVVIEYSDQLEQGKIETNVTNGKANANSDSSYNGDDGTISNNTEVDVEQPIITVTVGTKPINKTKTEEIPFETEYVYDPDLTVGEQVTDQNGQNGTRTITFERTSDGETITENEIDVEVTEPKNKVVRVGTKQTVTTDVIETPYDTEITEDPDLAVGEQRVTKGTPGKKTVTVTTAIDKDGNTVSTKEENVVSDPINEKIVIGTKVTDGNGETITRTVDIPFETEVITDDTLEKGQRIVDQTGKLGKRTITVTTPVENGVAKDPIVTDKVTEEAQKEVIRIGTKCEEVPVKPDPVIEKSEVTTIPFETKYIYDETLGYNEIVVDQDGVNGEKRTVTIKVDGKEDETITEYVKEPTTKIVRIGTRNATIVNGESKVDIPYETETIEDPTLDAGQEIIDQRGEKGIKYTQVYKIDVESGAILPDPDDDELVIKEPVKEIIRVGTKPVQPKPSEDPKPGKDETEPKPVNPQPVYPVNPTPPVRPTEDDTIISRPTDPVIIDIPFNTVVITDNDLPEGDTKLVLKGIDGEGYVNENGEVVVTRQPVDEIVRVGVKVSEQAKPVENTKGSEESKVPSNGNAQEENANESEESKDPEKENVHEDETDDDTTSPNKGEDEENIDSEVENEDDNSANKEDEDVIDTVADNDEDVDKIKTATSASKVPSSNPKTGIAGSSSVLATLALAMGGFYASKKKEDKEDK